MLVLQDQLVLREMLAQQDQQVLQELQVELDQAEQLDQQDLRVTL
jgi:hypothetical protein